MEILKNYERFFLEGGMKDFINDFRNPVFEAIINTKAHYDKSTDALRTTLHGGDEFPYEYSRIILFKTELEKRLIKLKRDSLQLIERSKRQYKSKPKKISELNEKVVNEIKTLRIEINKEKSLIDYVQILSSFLDDSGSEMSNLLLDKVIDSNSKLSFKPNCTKPKEVLSHVYQLDLETSYFINHDLTDHDTFIKIFCSKNIYNEESDLKIHFECETRVAAYILEKMESYFSNLSRKTVGESKRFYSKKNNLIVQNNLEVSLKRGNIQVRHQKEIDLFFAKLFLSHEQ